MQRRPWLWFLLSLLLFAGAAIFWQLGERWAGRGPAAEPPASRPRAKVLDATPRDLRHAETFRLLSAVGSPAAPRSPASLRLTNARLTPAEWLRRPTAVLLENALIDTATAGRPDVPPHLRAPGDPGAYIVQARSQIDEAFRTALRQAGAAIVAYIPNNAYLVRASRQVADQLANRANVQAVLPYEPYYKLRTDLLRLAVEQAALPLGERLNVAVFPDARQATLTALEALGARVLAEERSPFGPVLTVQPPPDSLVALASLPGVQVIEPALERVPANDLSRVRLGVAADTQSPNNWLGLTGTNVLVNVNDSGVDATHPDLAGRMIALTTNALTDTNGHGTHVIGSVAGNGSLSTTVSNASGSELPAVTGQFRGAAPGATVFVQSVLRVNRPARADAARLVPDSWLQEQAARTNALISNNSWHYAGNSGYDLAAARFDAATRDALPDTPGAQPLLFVFAAGNIGRGNDAGLGGDADSVPSPGTAKNVITVGAVEQPRDITNEVAICRATDTGTNVITLCETNQPWKGQTDTDDQVWAASGRGNTGVGVEGEQGRFKPDVVAPGAWVISTRSQQWDEEAYYNPTNSHADLYTDLSVEPGALNQYSIFVPYNAVQVLIDVLPNANSPVPFPGLPIYVRPEGFASTNDFVNTNHVALPPDLGPNLTPRDTVWGFAIGNTSTGAVAFNLRTEILTTNDLGNELEVRSNLNNTLGPWYRYESGSSMAAAHVAGTLALMQEFFEQRLGRTNSPALMKALLINGARALGPLYDLQVRTLHNYQGWGCVNLPTALPGALSNATSRTTGPILYYDQDPSRALATGDRHIRQLRVSDAARTLPLRVTLVWTDPPGNPAAGVKLVNDLDLVVTNLDTGEVFFGNDIVSGSDFTRPWPTNEPPSIDVVNNVENVFLPPLLGTNYTVTVIGSRINVNAVTAHTNNTVQDYALVLCSGDGDLDDALAVTDLPAVSLSGPEVRQFTNTFSAANTPGYSGTLLMGEHVGANTPLMGITNGMTNQWRFYVLTNTENYSNAAFVTFLPWTLSIPRLGVNEDRLANATRAEADIDLYVSLDPDLTNLAPAAVAAADKSRSRGGTEVLVYSNAPPGAVYYVGVKAEDQMAAEFGFLGVFSLLPFSEDDNGTEVLRGFPVPVLIPDGSPSAPGAGLMFALSVRPTELRRVVVTNTVTHENFGDLVGSLHHNTVFAVLNNHNFPYWPPPLTATTIYEDNGENDIPGAQHTAGPGSLRDFTGERAVGLWLMQMLDDALTQTGRLDGLTIRLEPQLIDNTNAWRAVQPFSFLYDFVNVPAGATNLTVCVYTTNAPVELYIRRGAFPSRTEYDKKMTIPVPGACMTVDLADLPPLTEGRYYIGVYNPNAVVQYVRIVVTLEIDPRGRTPVFYTDNNPVTLRDDAVTYATQLVTNRGRIATVEVGLRVDHPRVSDLAVTLISPRGTRILLTENRGWTNQAGFGSTYWITNVVPQDSSGGPAAYTNVIDTGTTHGTVTIDYEFYSIPDQLRVYYEGQLIFDTGLVTGGDVVTVPFGPGASTQITITMNEGNNPDPQTLWRYTVSAVQQVHNYLVFTENTDLATTPIKFAPPPFAPPASQTVQLLSDFEAAAPGDYVAPQTVDGWTVLSTNPVTVLEDAAMAHAGARYLALRSGEILRMLPTLPGRDYRLDFAYRSAPFMEGIISWWPGENDGMDVVDGNYGTLVGNANYTAGSVGQSFVFDGDRDGVNIGLAPNLQLQDFTIEAWVKRSSLTQTSLNGNGNGTLFALGTGNLGGPAGYNFYIRQSNNRLALGKSQLNEVTSDAQITDTNWHHVAVTKSDTDVVFYVDGIAYPAPSYNSGGFSFAAPGLIGAWQNHLGQVDNTFYGAIDELAVYGRALTDAEVQAIYAARDSGKCGMLTPPAICAHTCAKPTVQYPNFNSTAGLTLVGDAAAQGGVLRLTESREGENGAFWLVTKRPCAGGFDTRFRFRISDLGARPGTPLGADGFTFTVQNVAPNLDWALGATTNSVSVFFNTFLNWPGGTDYSVHDVSDNCVSIRVNDRFVAQDDLNARGINLSDGAPHEARIVSDGGLISVWLDGVQVLANVAFPGLASVTDNLGEAWVGFTSRTGWAWENHDILDWSFCAWEPAFGAKAYLPAGITNYFTGSTNWQTNTLFFTATDTSTPFGVAPVHERSGVWLDTFVLTELPGSMFVLPEESLKALADENPYGLWTLEILDTRADSTNLLPALLSWQLRFVFQNDVPVPGTLPPGVARTNTIPPGMFAYYVVDVPAWANFATNMLLTASNPLNIWFNQSTPPFGTNTGDYLLLDQVTSGHATLSATSVPPLQPGRRYYLGVQNTNTTAVTYALEVDFDITPLANGVPISSLSDPGLPPRYFSFDVSSNATAVVFLLTNLTGNVDLVVRKGPDLPTLGAYDYGSFNGGSLNEEVVVLTNSAPVPLSPGRWYLGVYNADIVTVVYTVVAAEYVSPAPIITLTNGVPYAHVAPPGGLDFYRYTVTPGAVRAQFEINGPTEDLTLLVRKGWPPPDFTSYHYLSANAGTNDEYLLIYNDSQPVPLTPGDWFLTVANNGGAAAGYAVKATEWPLTGQPIVVVSVGIASTNFCLAWTSLPGAHYYVQGMADLDAGVWTTISPTLTATDVLTTWCAPLASLYRFFRIVEGVLVQP